MDHERHSANPRPEYEPIQSAMHFAGVWQLITDTEETICRLLATADDGPEALEAGIVEGIRQKWPLMVVLPQIIDR